MAEKFSLARQPQLFLLVRVAQPAETNLPKALTVGLGHVARVLYFGVQNWGKPQLILREHGGKVVASGNQDDDGFVCKPI